MRTFINRTANIFGFGIGQDRVVVTVRDGRGVHAAQHLAMWHVNRPFFSRVHAYRLQASGLALGLLEALEALKQALTAAAAKPALALCPTTPCRLPASGCPMQVNRSSRPAESMRRLLSRSVNG